ncbi:uncharacterized, partial [Tachysurus ichikawai]
VDAANATTNATITLPSGGGLTVLPGLLSVVLPSGLLMSLLQHLHC